MQIELNKKEISVLEKSMIVYIGECRRAMLAKGIELDQMINEPAYQEILNVFNKLLKQTM